LSSAQLLGTIIIEVELAKPKKGQTDAIVARA
jgi:hypothetical protein